MASDPKPNNSIGDDQSSGSDWLTEEVTKIVNQCQVPGLKEKELRRKVKDLWNNSVYDDFDDKFRVELKLFNDPIHGSIQLNMLENAIVNTPEFYRLKDIKQLSGKNHVFPGATHTRFEHSIGVCHLAGKFIKHLNERSLVNPQSPNHHQQVLCVRLAGLCHDLGHGPFSHLFEKVTSAIYKGKKLKHEVLSGLVFKRILVKHPKVLVIFLKCNLTSDDVTTIVDMINCSKEILIFSIQYLLDIIVKQSQYQSNDRVYKSKKKKPKEKYLYEIVANKTSGMDVDKWDYFARDCHYLGLKNEFDMERCIALSSIVTVKGEYHVGFREKELRNIYGMFRTRCILFQKAYSHKTGNGIDLMIKDALIAVKDVPLKLPLSSDYTSLDRIISKAMDETDLTGYIVLTDSFLGALMIMPTENDSLKKAQLIIQQLSERQIYKAVSSLSFYSDEYEEPSETEAKKLEKDFNKYDEYEVEIVPIKYASEKFSKPEEVSSNMDAIAENTTDAATDHVEPDSDNTVDDEKPGDPVAGNMYFFGKEQNCKAIPDAIEIGKGNGMNACSKLILPKAFVEYRITLYSKTESPAESTKIEFERKVNDMMVKSKKKVEKETQT